MVIEKENKYTIRLEATGSLTFEGILMSKNNSNKGIYTIKVPEYKSSLLKKLEQCGIITILNIEPKIAEISEEKEDIVSEPATLTADSVLDTGEAKVENNISATQEEDEELPEDVKRLAGMLGGILNTEFKISKDAETENAEIEEVPVKQPKKRGRRKKDAE